jgi:hypothetical protein
MFRNMEVINAILIIDPFTRVFYYGKDASYDFCCVSNFASRVHHYQSGEKILAFFSPAVIAIFHFCEAVSA